MARIVRNARSDWVGRVLVVAALFAVLVTSVWIAKGDRIALATSKRRHPPPTTTTTTTTTPPHSSGTGDPVFGLTIDTVTDITAVVSGIGALPERPTIRVVFTWSGRTPTPPSHYASAVQDLDRVSTVMGELLDSTFESKVPVATYTADVKNYVATLGSTVNIWEIGNEVNGNWVGAYSTAAARLTDAYNDVAAAGATTALTLFANEYGPTHCGDGSSELTPVEFSEQYVPATVRDGLSYVFESYYPPTCQTTFPTNAEVASEMEQLHALYPNAKLGFGELGMPTAATSSTEPLAVKIMDWGYGLNPGLSYYVGGYFWWYAYEDIFTGRKLLEPDIGPAFSTEAAQLGG